MLSILVVFFFASLFGGHALADERAVSGLVVFYALSEGGGAVAADISDVGAPLNLELIGEVSWLASGNGVTFAGGRIGTQGPATKIIDALRATGTSSFEIWALPGNTVQTGPARLLSVGGDNSYQNFVLGQVGNDYQVRLLHTAKDPKARPRLTVVGGAAVALQHIVHTYDGSVENLFIDGVLQPEENPLSGTYANWDASDLFSIGNEASSERPFFGQVYLVAVYDRALSPVEVQQNYLAGPSPTLSANDAPVVDAGVDDTVTLPSDAQLIGTVSDDGLPNPPGAVSTTWSAVSGPDMANFADANALSTTVSFDTDGTYVLRLTADDGELSASDDVTITVQPEVPGNTAPVVDAGADDIVTLPSDAQLIGTVSDDGLPNPPGAVSTTWSTVSGPGTVGFADANALSTTVSFDTDGTYVLRLTADDGELSASDDVTITVQPEVPGNTAPVVDAGADDIVTLPSDAQLIGTVSDDGLPNPPGAVSTTWSAVSGPDMANFADANALSTTVSFDTDGTYVLRLTADDGELSASDDVTITVQPEVPGNTAPVVDAGADDIVTLPSDAQLIGTVSDDGLPSPPGAVSTTWSAVSGPDMANFADANALSTTVSFDTDGTYVLRLTADDGELSASDDVTITVQPAPSGPRVSNGLVAYYPLTEGSGVIVSDQSGNGAPLDLAIDGSVTWLSDGNGVSLDGGRIGTSSPASKIIDALVTSGVSTFEVWAAPANLTQSGPARLVSVGGDNARQNFVLGQQRSDYQVRLLHTGKDVKARPRLETAGGVAVVTQHLVHTYDGSVETLYIDGVPRPEQVVSSGTYANWDTADWFSIGNEASGQRAFIGEIYLVAVYERSLTPAEVMQNYNAGLPTSVPPDTTPPSIPQALVAERIGDTSVDLSWAPSDDNESGISAYRVDQDGALAATSSGPSATVTGLSPSTGYTFEVTAINGAGLESPTSDPLVLTTALDSTPPSIPANLAPEDILDTTVTFSWLSSADPETGISHYIVYRDNSQVGVSSTLQFTDTELAPETSYVYTVSAVNGDGVESAPSEPLLVTTLADGTPPPSPQGLVGNAASDYAIDLTWNAAVDPESGISFYTVYRDGSAVGTAASTSFTDVGLRPGTMYSYEVTATNGSGLESVSSNSVTVATTNDLPPRVLDISAGISNVTILFDEPLDASSATTAGNYTLDPSITITSILYNEGQTAVTLLTSPHEPDTEYPITIADVRDVSNYAMPAESTSYSIEFSPLDATGTLYIPYIEWEIADASWSGNPFDVVATTTFRHVGSDASITTDMFYSGTDSWKFRFSGTQTGTWTFSTTSDDPDLAGHTGTVVVLPNSNPAARGYVAGRGSSWSWSGSGPPFVPQLAMYGVPPYFHENGAQIDADIAEFLVEHGFNGFHVPGAAHWFDINQKSADNIATAVPDERTFEAFELLISKVYLAGGSVHIWMWGDDARRWTPTRWGINGLEDQRLQRYLAARLGPLPGWTMSYGFDLDEWVSEAELQVWVDHMRDRLGWPHLLGARPGGPNSGTDHSPYVAWNAPMEYASFEHHKPDYETYLQAVEALPDRPAMSEDRFRIRGTEPKDYDMDEIRRGLWQSTMAGGVANIWGVEPVSPLVSEGASPSEQFPSPQQVQTYSTYFTTRWLDGYSRCNGLTDGVALCAADNDRYLFYAEAANSVRLDLSGMAGSQSVVAVDTTLHYAEIDLGVLDPVDQVWTAPYVSDWAIAVGDFDPAPPDATPPSVPDGLTGVALSDTEISLSWLASADARSDVTSYRVYRSGVQVGNTAVPEFLDSGLIGSTSYDYTVTAVNGAGMESEASAAVSVTTEPENQPPFVDAGADTSVTLPNPARLAGSATDDGLPDPPGVLSITWTQVSGPGTASFADNASLATEVSFDIDGTYVLGLTANDGEFSSADEVTVVVNPPAPNTPPELAAIGDQSVAEGGMLTVSLSASDIDGDALAFGNDGLPAFATLADQGNGTATLSVAPGFDDSGVYALTIRVTDNGEPPLSDEETFNLTVTNVNRAPVIQPIDDVTVTEGDVVTVLISANDPDGDGVDFSSPNLPGYATLNNLLGNTAEIVLSPGAGDVGGPVSITVEATDDAADSQVGTTDFDVTVNPFNPRVSGGLVAYYPLTEGSGVVVTDQSGNGAPLDLAVNGAVTWLSDNNGVSLDGGRIGTSASASKIIDALVASGTSSFEVWAAPANVTQVGPARLVSVGGDNSNQNLVLGQLGSDYQVRLLHTAKDAKARPRLQTTGGVAMATQHLVHTYDGNVETLYIDGVAQPEQVTASGTYANWDASDWFNIGNEASGERPFLGEIYLVAIYDRALTPAEVLQNYSAGPAAEGDGPPPQPAFTDITDLAGVAGPAEFGGHGVQFADIDGDGLADFYVTRNFTPTDMPDLLYHNLGSGDFVEEGATRGVDSFDTGTHGGVWADFDNDGDYDLFNGSYDENRLYENDGAGFFIDVSASAGLSPQLLPTRGAVAFDMDGDGDLDIFAVSNYLGSNDPPDELNEVYRNDGSMAFTPIAAGDLESAPAGQGAIAVDYDNDGDMDLLSANRTGPMNVLQNDGTGVFTLLDPVAIGLTISAGDGITAADVDNDGWLDLLLDQHLFRGTGGGNFNFARSFETSNNSYMGGFADLDNDADFDIVFPGRNYVYFNDGAGKFVMSPTFTIGAVDDPRSVSFADIENDGDLDFTYAQKRDFNILVRNDLVSSNNWMKFELTRASGQAGAFGARIFLYEAGGLDDPNRRIVWTESVGAIGYLAQDDPVVHLGIGDYESIDVRVQFLNGAAVTYLGVPANSVLAVGEPASP